MLQCGEESEKLLTLKCRYTASIGVLQERKIHESNECMTNDPVVAEKAEWRLLLPPSQTLRCPADLRVPIGVSVNNFSRHLTRVDAAQLSQARLTDTKHGNVCSRQNKGHRYHFTAPSEDWFEKQRRSPNNVSTDPE